MPSLLLLNGSPRGSRGNTLKMLVRVGEGWQRGGGAPPEVFHLAQPEGFAAALAAFATADAVLLGMPLYVDAMPALVLAFIEALGARPGPGAAPGRPGPVLGFLVQSGFPEAAHSRPLQRYLEKLAPRLGSPCAGTIVHGAGEALQCAPDRACARLWERLRALGQQFARERRFGAPELRAVAGPERLPAPVALLLGLALRLAPAQFYWKGRLKRNGAWSRRDARPYARD